MPSALSIRSTFRNTLRFAEVLEVLARYGFGGLLAETGLDKLIERGRELLGATPHEIHHLTIPQRLRMVLEELGPTFIKLGQILSTRPDLIPAEYIEEFRRLQHDTNRVDFARIKERLDAEFGGRLDEVVQSVDPEPVAAASIAQVHRARLKDGTPIVLKIIKPGVEQQVATDVEVLTDLAAFVEKRVHDLPFSPMDVVHEFRKQIYKELDLILEGKAMDRLQRAFEEEDNVNFPKVYWEATTRRVLAEEEIHGKLLSTVGPNDLSADERRAIVENGARGVFRMCFGIGFFHADPHPGNVIVQPGGAVCFIDLGMTGHIEDRMKFLLADYFRAVVAADLDRVMRRSLELADADPTLEKNRALRGDTWELISRFQSESIAGLDIVALLNGLLELLKRYKIRMPADLVYLVKALTTMQSVGNEIAPDFDILGFIQPYLIKLVAKRYSLGALRERFQKSAMSYLEFAENLPEELRAFSAQLRRRDFSVRLEHNGLVELTRTIAWASKILSISWLLSAVIIASSILIFADRGFAEWGFLAKLGMTGLIGSGIVTLGVVFFAYRRRPR